MSDIIKIIKTQYFSDTNISYILNFNFQTQIILSRSDLFYLQNNIYNLFIDQVHKKIINVNSENIEEILISLNQLTFKLIQEPIQQPIQEPIQESTPIQPPIQEPIPIQPPIQEPIQESIPIQQPIEQPIQPVQSIQQANFHLFSEYFEFCNGDYIFDLPVPYIGEKLQLQKFNFFNNLYNINKQNNTFEIIENSKTFKINIPIGNYSLIILLDLLEKLIKSKTNQDFNITYNENKNRIIFSSQNTFVLKFIEHNSEFIELNELLGFSKKIYNNNNTYTSDNDNQINWLDSVYIKCNANVVNYQTNADFEYSSCFNYNNIETFNKYNQIILNDKIILNENNSRFKMSFYIKCKNGFKKITDKIRFDFIFNLH